MSSQQGFLIRKNNGKLRIDSRKTTSILSNQLQADYVKEFSSHLTGRLLDIGCGEKPYKLIYDDICDNSIGVDVETCRHEQKYVDVFASADDMPFEDTSFDSVLCTNVLEHVSNMEKAFEEIARVLKKGGCLMLSVPFLYPVHEAPYDYYRFTQYGLEHQLAKNGFRIVKKIPWGGVGLMSLVYFNFIWGKMLNNGVARKVSCLLQRGCYVIYKKFFYHKLICERGRICRIVTMGNFIVAEKI